MPKQKNAKKNTEVAIDKRQLWTTTTDYCATGEGRSIMAHITWAETAEEAIVLFGERFDPYFARGAQAVPGVTVNTVTSYLFSSEILKKLVDLEARRAHVDTYASMHFNLS